MTPFKCTYTITTLCSKQGRDGQRYENVEMQVMNAPTNMESFEHALVFIQNIEDRRAGRSVKLDKHNITHKGLPGVLVTASPERRYRVLAALQSKRVV